MNCDEFRTENQIKRSQRNAEICERYASTRKQQPLVSRNRVMVVIAKDYGITSMTVKKVLKANNAYL